jgi:hypothetical protein
MGSVAGFVIGERESEKGKEVKRVKRILLVLTVALVMAALLVVSVAPAFAANGGPRCKGHSPHGVCHHGGPP